MDDYIIKEGDVLAFRDGRQPIVVRRIGKTHVTYVVRGEKKERKASRAQFHYILREEYAFLLEHAC